MNTVTLQNVDIEHFLTSYWQQKPLLIKGGFTQFTDPIDEHDLAGLAQEADIDSRIISRHNNDWQVHSGPFDDFNAVCQHQWSLLVQGVEKHIPDTQPIVDAFRFLPFWRIDDLMVSYSVPGAGVGPHVDQYDVFIIQGKGTRNWKVGNVGSFESLHPHPKLTQIRAFEPIIDVITEPGDILYIPPGAPHEGIALTPCLNYSVGFRAPQSKRLISSFADYLLDNAAQSDRYSDPQIPTRNQPGELKPQELEKLRSLMKQAIDGEHFNRWCLSFASQALQEHELPFALTCDISDIIKHFTPGVLCEKGPGIKPVYLTPDSNQAHVTFYVEAEEFECTKHDWEHVEYWLNNTAFEISASLSESAKLLLARLIQLGFWCLPDCEFD